MRVSKLTSKPIRQTFKASISTLAPYVKHKRPLNIAHRGLAGLVPENTIQAFEAALYSGADFIQLDVVFTKDNELLVMHDPYLGRITNAAQTQLGKTKQKRTYLTEKRDIQDGWTDLFTLQELMQLKIKQKQSKNRITSFDGYFGFSTLGQVIEKVKAFNVLHKGKRNPNGKIAGILIQAKDGDMYRSIYGEKKSIGKQILKVLRNHGVDTWQSSQINNCPIYLHSFDAYTVRQWHEQKSNLPRNLLLQLSTLPKQKTIIQIVQQASKYSHGVGVEDLMLWDSINNKPNYDLIKQIRDLQMLLHVWTFKDDDLIFNASSAIQAYRIGQIDMKLDGIITQFCDTFAPISQFLEWQEDSRSKNK